MKIAVEVDVLAHEAKTGVYYYLQRLLKATLTLDHQNDYALVYFGSPQTAQGFGLPLNRTVIKTMVRFPRKLYNLLLRTPFAPPIDRLARVQADLFIFPAFVRWPLGRTKQSLVVVHDTAYVDHPEVIATQHFRRYLSRAVPRSIDRATKVIAVSESTKASLMRHYGTPAEKIAVITPALDHATYRPAEPAEIRRVTAKYRITKPYLLYVGTLEPRKNIVGLIAAYQALPDELRQQYQLVLAGQPGWKNEAIKRAVASVPTQDLMVTGYVPEADIVALYSGATAFIYPSLYEGWGMQLLEAMACGVPVITTDNSSLPEVAGEAAIITKTGDQPGLNTQLARLLADEALRRQLSQAGLRRAAQFTWAKSAEQLLAVFRAIDRF